METHVDEQIRGYRAAVTEAVLDGDTFLRLTMSGKVRGQQTPWVKVVARPVAARRKRGIQVSYFSDKKNLQKNFVGEEVGPALESLLGLPFGQIHVQCTSRDLHVRRTKKNRVLMRHGRPSRPDEAPVFDHNRKKRRLLEGEGAGELLRAIGIAGKRGDVLPSMQGKFRQVNEFLRHLRQMIRSAKPSMQRIQMVDCGCGRAYLTFAAHDYLSRKKGIPTHLTGIDHDPAIVETCRAIRDDLQLSGVDFRICEIAEYVPETGPDIVLSLHACDTATDEAIALGVQRGSRIILAAPCCQHELRSQLDADVFGPVLRHGVLKQRTADILTDAFRAQALRIMGYRTDVVEFVDPERTAKNLMIRAVKTAPPGDDAEAVDSYRKLRAFWNVSPSIERLLGKPFQRMTGVG